MRTTKFKTARRGAAMVVVMMLTGVLLLVSVSVLMLAYQQRLRATAASRGQQRDGCAMSGLQIARAFYGNNFKKWGNYLAAGSAGADVYNAPAVLMMPKPDRTRSALATTVAGVDPKLLIDLDGDNLDDVYIFIRDNDDEYGSAAPNVNRDNDQVVVVGAACISTTMVPRNAAGTVDTDALVMEGMLAYNNVAGQYQSQAAAGASGTGNLNTGAP